ncbi:MAG: S8 family serine peptidase [Candidatus Heimdallarchaeota archaeon]|nr:S8 family serine peptidase [Candidatus Heimdallarchaeota archaeon]
MKITYIKIKIIMLFVIGIMMLGTPGFTGVADYQLPGANTLSVPQSVVDGIALQKVDSYIVMMYDLPVVAYDGDIKGLKATKNPNGKINPNSANVQKYVSYLSASHDEVMASVGLDSSAKIYDYVYALNGFAAKMTEYQAFQLNARSDVFSVQPNEISFPQTDSTPDFLGLTDPAGPWGKGFTGEGVVVGIIDTGIWPEHASFVDDGTYRSAPADFSGTGCEFVSFTCNNKLLAAKAYRAGFATLVPNEYDSARDSDGHGSHTASTAAGNSGVAASILGSDLGIISGIAPRAQLSIYKVCWNNAGCAGIDLSAAIDQAVADGVDVINYSIGSSSFVVGSDDVAFLFAEAAGVMVATSNGNSGPGAATTGSPASVPWVTSVGASTQERTFSGTVTLGDGSTYTGVTLTSGTGDLEIVDSADHNNELCDSTVSFSPSISGKIVLCLRGEFARVEKSHAVALGGGAGMILYNPVLQTLNSDNHFLPSLHVDHIAGPRIKAYIASNGGSGVASLSGSQPAVGQGSVMAAFSSRGPNRLSSDIIKPDVTAPGVNILAANSLTPYIGSPGQAFQAISGTSMSSPHVAGLFALLSQANPDWTPAMAKSALMTTARQDVTKEDGVTDADPFDMGAGHVAPGGMANKGSFLEPGLVYDAGLFEYAAFTCGADLGIFSSGTCNFLAAIGIPIDPADLNTASIGIGELVGSQTIQRTVTSVTNEIGWRSYSVSVDAPAGFDVTVWPSHFSLKSGMSITYEVTITNNGNAGIGDWSFGSLTWADSTGHYEIDSTIAVRAFEIDAPAEVTGSGTDGSISFDISFGFDGDYSAVVTGLAAADQQTATVIDDPTNNINVALATGVGVNFHFISITDAALARFSLYDDHTDGQDDLDLYIFGPASAGFPFVGGSGSGTSAEQVDIANPTDGVYIAVVHGWQTDGPDSTYTLFTFGVPTTTGGSLMVVSAPASASVGTVGTVVLGWSGLSSERKYMGMVQHYSGTTLRATTFVTVDTFP